MPNHPKNPKIPKTPNKRNRNTYDHRVVEKKWQELWEKNEIYKSDDLSAKEKYYLLVEFPYPSGAGLHVGHVRSWASMDAFARKKRMQGYNVMYPMGWDAFGLPAENYAIKTGIHPSKTVPQNIAVFKKQCKSLGLSFDWDRELDTTDPNYYKWTQWIFIQLFKNDLAYRCEVSVNWCPKCKTNLADEEVLPNGTHERCGTQIEIRSQKQWLLRITDYADRLLEDLNLVDYSPKIRIQQENWIGRKDWIDITYPIEGTKEEIIVSTTRPDTNFGATFIVIAPEHPLVGKILKRDIKTDVNLSDIEKYIKLAKNKSELERISEGRKKTGVFTGLYAVNQLNGYKMPVYITDFVLMSVGTGAVVGVPASDIRDFEFAQEFNIPVVRVIVGDDGYGGEINNKNQVCEEGTIVNSGFLDGLQREQAVPKMMDYLEEKGWGKRTVRYHIHDWIFSRQHYWGEPIPMIYCEKCAKESKSWFTLQGQSFKGKVLQNPSKSSKPVKGLAFNGVLHQDQTDWDSAGWFPVSEEQLPLELPYLEKYEPSGTGESPLANAKDWIKTKCPNCGGEARRETDTMPNWAGSNWYFVRYVDNKNNTEIANAKKVKYWLPVDFYQGGFEHTTLHLLYSRFIYKFLFDIGVVFNPEPYLKRRSHGIVLGADGRKMSKSFGNVINPDQIVEKFGADTLRLYEMFMGPFENVVAWSEESLEGCYRFLNRLWRAFEGRIDNRKITDISIDTKLHQTVKKVSEDLDNLKFNTAISSMMELLNMWEEVGSMSKDNAELFLRILAPFAPHLAEEVWQKYFIDHQPLTINYFESIHLSQWPTHDEKYLVSDEVVIVVQINGKFRSQLIINNQTSTIKDEVVKLAKQDQKVSKYLEGHQILKEIFVSGKLVNFVI